MMSWNIYSRLNNARGTLQQFYWWTSQWGWVCVTPLYQGTQWEWVDTLFSLRAHSECVVNVLFCTQFEYIIASNDKYIIYKITNWTSLHCSTSQDSLSKLPCLKNNTGEDDKMFHQWGLIQETQFGYTHLDSYVRNSLQPISHCR